MTVVGGGELKAVICTSLGFIEELQVLDVPPPPLSAGEVRVAVKAASLNFMDVLKIKGSYQVKQPLPFTVGDEFAGIVSELGSDVRGIAVGDRVAQAAAASSRFPHPRRIEGIK